LWLSNLIQSTSSFDIYTPTEEHGALREMLASFVKTKVEPQVRLVLDRYILSVAERGWRF
jgi:hypothetical protein